MKKKRPPTNIELEQTLKTMKEGEIRRIPQFDMMILKGTKRKPYILEQNLKNKAKVIYPKQ